MSALHRRLRQDLPRLLQSREGAPRALWRALLLELIEALFSKAPPRRALRPHVEALSGLQLEAIGHVLEGLLDLEAHRATAPMVRIRRGALEAIVPASDGEGAPISTGTLYLRTGAGRKASGAYYTPQSLVAALVARTVLPDARRVLDPAMGAGHFLLGAARHLAPDRRRREAIVRERLFGVDREPLAVALARRLLWADCGGQGPLPSELSAHLRCGDALTGALPEDTVEGEPDGVRFGEDLPRTFDTVVGNPPWEKVIPLEREFFSSFDARILLAPTARERAPLYARLRADPAIEARWQAYATPFARLRAFVDRTYRHQSGGGHPDLSRYFLERAWNLLSENGRLGMILPNAIYSSKGAAGVRRMLLNEGGWRLCLGFINNRRLFDINRSHRFCLIVAERQADQAPVSVAFGLTDPAQLDEATLIPLSRDFLNKTSPEHGTFLEVESLTQRDRLAGMMESGVRLGAWMAAEHISLYQEMNMTLDSPRFTAATEVLSPGADPRVEPLRSQLLDQGWLVVHEKGTFHQYDDLLKDQPRYLCRRSALTEGAQRPRWVAAEACAHFRLAARATIHAAEAQKSCFALLPPGVVVGNSALTERQPHQRSLQAALVLLAVANSRALNEAARLFMGTNLNQFLLNNLPFPRLNAQHRRGLAARALRLSCTRSAYAPLWVHFYGESWPGPPRAAERERLRAEIDEMVEAGFKTGSR